ncbi:uncharacterized protein LOC115743139 [Rhodamnia argentea]|uniref:Uncharacterized protein LOC115743139 n=1 Tax=Rhodamnia argentea TaxID=178133 RepID=A0A8B8PHN9_9MYRT|nr:uncharacterized protein LOC115743139 [Rhodamnia argentea]XP_030533649.1 uncharacterized protein LOC115743139 [Rhodamnia argentea]XP_030533651.1 uncharacterized protein LOC115743139 [Rhodamnia argentea]XP_030533652.1 uncharacterized protein LOC115743139 [Rhodamnia argentea]XP_048132188.1 uncharacterized protein LOC115743139 [Rhodamnia argentea]
MAKKSQRRPVQREKNQASCMWGLIRILDFRSSRKLLTDQTRPDRLVAGAANPRNKLELLNSCDEDLEGMLDCEEGMEMIGAAGKNSVKSLIEKELVSEDVKTGVSKTGIEHKRSSLAQEESQRKKNRKRSKRSLKKSYDLDRDHFGPTEGSELKCSCDQNTYQLLAANHNENEIVEDLCQEISQKSSGCKKCDPYGQVRVLLNSKHSDMEEKLFELINEFLSKQLTSGKHLKECENMQCSTDVKMLQFLASAEFSLLDLLRDPNKTVMQYIQSLQDSHLESPEEFNLSGEQDGLRQYEDSLHHEQLDKLGRRAESQGEKSFNRNEKSPVSNRIVILKPGMTDPLQLKRGCNPCSSPQILYTAKRQSTRANAHYFISDIKRKLKNMVVKEHPGITVDGPEKWHCRGQPILGSVGENVGKCSASKDHLYVELAGIKREKSKDKPGDIQVSTKMEAADNHEHRLSNVYVEAKKHLFEMLNHGDADAVSLSRQCPETLGRILSNPKLNCFPTVSPRSDSKHGILNHPHSSTRRTIESCISKSFTGSVQTLESDLNITEMVLSSDKVETADASTREEMISEDICGATRLVIQGDHHISGPPSEPVKSLGVSVESIPEDECSKPMTKKSYGMEQQPLSLCSSPPSALTIKRVEDLELVIDRSDRPSPVSVLEPLFTEDDISPACPVPVELSTQSLLVEFEDDFSTTDEEIYLRNFEAEKELVFEYVKKVLEVSNLDCDDLYLKSQSSDQLIELSVLDEVDFFGDHLHSDHKLLFDCINEVLLEVFEYDGSCYPSVSFVKRRINPIPNMKYAVLEVCRGVHWHLLPLPLPRSLEQIVQKDMSRMGTWMGLHFDVQNIGVEMSEAIIAELIEEIMSSCVNERVRRANAVQSVLLGHMKLEAWPLAHDKYDQMVFFC